MRPARFSYRPDPTAPSIFGAHQTGIATAHLDHAVFTAWDVDGDLDQLLRAWSAVAESLMGDGDVTVLFGLGPGVLGDPPLGLRRALPSFAGDALEPAWCGGDVCTHVCARSAVDAAAAVDALADPRARLRWTQAGSLPRERGDRVDGTPRDVLGFRDGTSNLRRGRDLERHVWIAARDKSWIVGGTYLVVRRIVVDLHAWRALGLDAQERVIGRHRDSGAPLGGRREYDPYELESLPADSHVRLAAAEANGGVRVLRRSYSFDDGLLFLAFCRDPLRQYVPLQRRLASGDALGRFATHVGSAVFAIPPGARAGGYIGDTLP